MANTETFVATTVERPVRLIDVQHSSAAPREQGARSRQFSNVQDMDQYLREHDSSTYATRYISICQQSSWSPLQITRPMMDSIVSRHGIGASFSQLATCFYTRTMELEETFCIPLAVRRTGSVLGKLPLPLPLHLLSNESFLSG
jgi:hypothetical protein